MSRKTFRSELYVDYKANRSASPDEFKGQVDLVKEVLDALNVPHLGVEGFEADDVIATLATEAEQADFDVLICTGDRDAFQLVSDRVTVLYPRKGVSDLARMTPTAVEERYFVAPDRYPRAGRPGRGDQRQPPRYPRRRTQDRGEVADHLRRARQPDHPRRRAQGQGRGGPSRSGSTPSASTGRSTP